MSYWGIHPEDSDFARTSLGVIVLHTKKKMLQDIEVVKSDSYPEQSILSCLICLRLIGKRFPKTLSVHFRKKDFEKAKNAFYSWYEEVKDRIPQKYREGLLEEAESEFQLFEEEIFG
jgi:hypothetical protein